MPEPSTDLPRNNRPEPKEWAGLVEFSEAQLAAAPEPEVFTNAKAEALSAEFQRLDNEQLDANRYYGLGLIICRFAAELQQPKTRQRVVRGLANIGLLQEKTRALAEAAGHEFVQLNLRTVVDTIALQASTALPVPERTVTDTLVEIERFRRKTLEGKRERIDPDRIRRVENGAELVAVTATQGATIVIENVIALRNAFPGREQPKTYADLEPGDPALLKTAERSARLRLDKFVDLQNYRSLFEYDKSGEPILRIERARQGIDIPPDNSTISRPVLHSETLICPAFHVQGLIPLMLEIVPEVWATTQEMLDQQRRG